MASTSHDPTARDIPGLHGLSSPSRNERIEAVLCLIMAVFSIFTVAMGFLTGTVLSMAARSPFLEAACLSGLIFYLAAEAWFLVTAYVLIKKGDFPLGLKISARLPPVPWPLRPIVALWWLAHFLWALLWVLVFILNGHNASLTAHLLIAIPTAGLTYLSSSYLMLIVTTFTRRPDWIMAVWNRRVYLAILEGMVVLVLGLRLH